jgi:hypothetical protein
MKWNEIFGEWKVPEAFEGQITPRSDQVAEEIPSLAAAAAPSSSAK